MWKPRGAVTNLRPWPLRLLWILVPLTTGSVLDDALDGRVASFRVGVQVAFWVLWGLALVAMFVPRVETLTLVRTVVPAAPVAAIWAGAVTTYDAVAVIAVAVACAAAAVALSASVGDLFVNGSSYGDERRMPLRAPAPMLVGPVPLAWALAVAGAAAGPLLLLAHVWILGAVLTVAGWPLTFVAVRALHRLAERWVVFVPAGFVLHDHLALREPVLFAKGDLVALGPAPADTQARDLTARAAGLALQVDFAIPVEVAPTAGATDGVVEMVGISQFVFTPSRPGEVLAEAERRKLRVRRA